MDESRPEAPFRAAFEQYPVAAVLTDERGFPVTWNRAFDSTFRTLSAQAPDSLGESLFAWLERRESFKFSH